MSKLVNLDCLDIHPLKTQKGAPGSYILPPTYTPGHSERPRTAPSIRNRQISSEGRQMPQAARAQDIGEAEARVNSAPVNSYTSQRYTRNEYIMHD